MAAGLQARPADVEHVRQQLGLSRPPLARYALFWARFIHLGPPRRDPVAYPDHDTCAVLLPFGGHSLHADLGKSFQLRQPVIDLVLTRLPRTAMLALAGLFVQVLLGVASGTVAALQRGSLLDRFLVSTSVLGISAPTFLIALVLQVVFARELRWLPLDGYGATAVEHLRSLVLPAITLGIYGAAFYTRLVRDEMSHLLRQDWVRTARAKGLPAWRVVAGHAFPNALVSVITAAGLDFGVLMSGAVVTETVFRWPGLGELSLRATLNRDGPVVCGCLIVTGIAVALASLAVDLAYPLLDPRSSPEREPGLRA
jgi:peptide/nickel transport system permease protein